MFLYYTSEALKDESLILSARQLAGILFKNTVLNTTKDEEWVNLWRSLSLDEIEALKDSLLQALGDEKDEVIRAAGSCISAICILEFPEDKWPDLIVLLCKNINHEFKNIREASLLTLGYIWEELKTNELKREDSDYIISAFIDALEQNKDDPKIIKQTIQGVYHSVKFAIEIFKEGKAAPIMNGIYQTLGDKDTEIRVIAMQCIVEIVRYCYDYLSPFMGDISEHTLNHARGDEEEVQTQAFEVWSSIAEEEIMKKQDGARTKNIIDQAFDMLMELIQEVFQHCNKDEVS